MKTILLIIINICLLLYVGGFTVAFSPFSVSLPGWRMSVILVSVMALLLTVALLSYRQGFCDGAEMAFEEVKKVFKEDGNGKEDSLNC